MRRWICSEIDSGQMGSDVLNRIYLFTLKTHDFKGFRPDFNWILSIIAALRKGPPFHGSQSSRE